MATKYIKGNALDFASKDGYCMIHVCNNKGKMGAGIAKQVAKRFPMAYRDYERCHRLGTCSYDYNTFNCFNLVAQDGYGRDGRRYLNYGALAESLHVFMNEYSFGLQDMEVHTVVVPHGMGAGLAGGNWEIVLEMVEFTVGQAFEILVVEYDQ